MINKSMPNSFDFGACSHMTHKVCDFCGKGFHGTAQCPECTDYGPKIVNHTFWCNEIQLVSKKPQFSDGWVAPNGEFFPFLSHEHDYYGKIIALKWGITNKHGNLEDHGDLTVYGWIRVSRKGDIISEANMTQNQLDTIWDLITIWPKPERDKLNQELRYLIEDLK